MQITNLVTIIIWVSCDGGGWHWWRSSSSGEAGLQVWVVLAAASAGEGCSRCPLTAAAAGEGCSRGVHGGTVSADEGLLPGPNHTLPAVVNPRVHRSVSRWWGSISIHRLLIILPVFECWFVYFPPSEAMQLIRHGAWVSGSNVPIRVFHQRGIFSLCINHKVFSSRAQVNVKMENNDTGH